MRIGFASMVDRSRRAVLLSSLVEAIVAIEEARPRSNARVEHQCPSSHRVELASSGKQLLLGPAVAAQQVGAALDAGNTVARLMISTRRRACQ
jgi:hypothetical protein